MHKPQPGEYNPYYDRYIELVQTEDILKALANQAEETASVLRQLTNEQASYRYAPDKWSIKQMLGHVIDAERVFAYRAMCIARGEQQSLPGFDENDYVRCANFDEIDLQLLIAQFHAVRLVTHLFFTTLAADAWTHKGNANNHPVSVRAIAWIIAGHELHHRGILKSRYLAQ